MCKEGVVNMFGSKILAGHYDFSIDFKNRMFLPAQTGREQGNVVYVCYDKDIECYTIYSEKSIADNLDKFNKKIDSAQTSEELKNYKLMYLEFANSIIKVCTVDSQGRIVLPVEIASNQNVHIVGSGDHLVLMFNDTKKKK